MHPPLCRDAVPSAILGILLIGILQFPAVVLADPPETFFEHGEIAGSARRRPIEAQPPGQSSRVGGQPRNDLVEPAAYGEAVAERLPELFARPSHLQSGRGTGHGDRCGAEFASSCEASCGLESCPTCASGVSDRRDDSVFLWVPVPRINWCRSQFFGGVQSFSGPANYAGVGTEPTDRRGSSSFGIHHGMSGAQPLAWLDNQASAQLGIRGTQNNFEGANFTDNSRRQVFVTGGFFRRVDYGLQGGVVADFLHDDWYYVLNLAQLRGEISWKSRGGHEIGYGYMAGFSDDRSRTVIAAGDGTFVADTIAMEAVNQNRLFYRHHFSDGGFAEAFGGVSGDDDGLLGASLELPLHGGLALRSGVSYLIPETSDEQRDHQEESWNLGLSFVWYPCGGCRASRYQQPLMDVADNGTFMIDRQ